MPAKLVIENAWILQVKGVDIFPVFGDLTIESGIIRKIVEKNFTEFLKHPDKINSKSFNASGRVVTIPLVNFHDHIYSRLAKGLPVLGPMNDFQAILHNLWWKLDRALDHDIIAASAKMAAIESIRNGVTYIFDHHSSPEFTAGSLQTIANELLDFNLRGVLCFETTDRYDFQHTKAALEENMKFLEKYSGDRFKAMLGLHASFTLTDETLAEASKLVHDLNLGIHIHLCEDKSDREISKNVVGDFPVQRLNQHDLLNPLSILSHGIHLTKNDYSIIVEKGSAIANNPDSNMNNNVGLPAFDKIPGNIPLLCGTDGMHANIAKTMKEMFLLFRHSGKSFNEAFHLMKKIYFDQITFAKRYFTDFPSLNLNDRADLIIWDYVPPTPVTSSNIWGHFVYGILERQIHSVVQEGTFLMKDFQLAGVDESNENAEIYKQGERLHKKLILMNKR